MSHLIDFIWLFGALVTFPFAVRAGWITSEKFDADIPRFMVTCGGLIVALLWPIAVPLWLACAIVAWAGRRKILDFLYPERRQ